MRSEIRKKILAKGKPEYTSLYDHLRQVSLVAEKIAVNLGLDSNVARSGAILHDIGKASTIFQYRLRNREKYKTPFRHEIASCFFISLFPEGIHGELIEMVIAHHKSVESDARDKGLLDLYQNWGDELFALHIAEWNSWKEDALTILKELGIEVRDISEEEAKRSFEKVYNYCEDAVLDSGYSEWRGLLMAADHFASALSGKTEEYLSRLFKKPDLNFFDRQHNLYPLSLKSSESDRPHTIVVACTGAGKTDYLFRRCKGRVFYTLPFQASINAMYKRVKHDLTESNPDIDIRLLHASSSVVVSGVSKEEKIIQSHVGAAVKVLTPHQIAAIAFGTNGYEAMLLDIKGSDVILDEIHTYTDVTRAIVLKIVSLLKYLKCRIHIGTATMPTILYDKILEILGKESVLEIKLDNDELDLFNRHTVHKINDWEAGEDVIDNSINDDQKVLIVCNRVQHAQERYKILSDRYPEIPILLLHSRFKRSDRNHKEQLLLGLDQDGVPNGNFNTSRGASIVISTQIVEVSLDISFDVMITEAAPLDALIQRFGRINRKRNSDTIGKYKPVYILAPPEEERDALPYNLDIIKSSYSSLDDGKVLNERELQQKIDSVFIDIDLLDIETFSVFKEGDIWNIDKLTHNPKARLLDLLDIDSISCICESDESDYIAANDFSSDEHKRTRSELTISTRYYVVKGLRQLIGHGVDPFVIPDAAYSEELGLQVEKAKPQFYGTDNSFL